MMEGRILLDVDQYGSLDLFAHINMSSDHVQSSEDLMWHGVLINQQPGVTAGSVGENIRGVTLNQLLLIYFNVLGKVANPNKETAVNLTLPGGEEFWCDSLDNILSIFPTICPISCVLQRVLCLIKSFFSSLHDPALLENTMLGSIEFLWKLTSEYSSFTQLEQLLSIHSFSKTAALLIRDPDPLRSSIKTRNRELVSYLLNCLEKGSVTAYRTLNMTAEYPISIPNNRSQEIALAREAREAALEMDFKQQTSTTKNTQSTAPGKINIPKFEVFGVSLDMSDDDDSFSKSSSEGSNEGFDTRYVK